MARIDGTNGADNRQGTANNDTFYMKDGNDQAQGLGGDDRMHGGGGRDTLHGGAGADTLFGEAGQDALVGGAGRDVLIGGDGSDSLWGQGGGDFFRFNQAQRDAGWIMDFDRTEDLIDLRGIDANWNAAGDQHYTFIGDADFTGRAGELRYDYYPDLGYGILMGDNDGDGQQELALQVRGVSMLGNSDFLL